jgi:hypothetical protein
MVALTVNLRSTMTIVVVDTLVDHSMVLNVVETHLLGGINLLGGIQHIADVATMYLTEMTQLLGGQHLLGGNAVKAALLHPVTTLVILANAIVTPLSAPIANGIALFKHLVLQWILMKLMKMTTILTLLRTVNLIDYLHHLLNVHIVTRPTRLILLFWIITLVNHSANPLRFRFFLVYVPNAKGDEALVLIVVVVIILL